MRIKSLHRMAVPHVEGGSPRIVTRSRATTPSAHPPARLFGTAWVIVTTKDRHRVPDLIGGTERSQVLAIKAIRAEFAEALMPSWRTSAIGARITCMRLSHLPSPS